jgi:hypothetical protein
VETAPSSFDGLVRVEVVVRLDDPDEDPIELARLVTLVDERSAAVDAEVGP